MAAAAMIDGTYRLKEYSNKVNSHIYWNVMTTNDYVCKQSFFLICLCGSQESFQKAFDRRSSQEELQFVENETFHLEYLKIRVEGRTWSLEYVLSEM